MRSQRLSPFLDQMESENVCVRLTPKAWYCDPNSKWVFFIARQVLLFKIRNNCVPSHLFSHSVDWEAVLLRSHGLQFRCLCQGTISFLAEMTRRTDHPSNPNPLSRYHIPETTKHPSVGFLSSSILCDQCDSNTLLCVIPRTCTWTVLVMRIPSFQT